MGVYRKGGKVVRTTDPRSEEVRYVTPNALWQDVDSESRGCGRKQYCMFKVLSRHVCVKLRRI
jgi:hypothetical protein